MPDMIHVDSCPHTAVDNNTMLSAWCALGSLAVALGYTYHDHRDSTRGVGFSTPSALDFPHVTFTVSIRITAEAKASLTDCGPNPPRMVSPLALLS